MHTTQKDCEILITDGHVTGHRFRAVTRKFFARSIVAYVATGILCISAAFGGVPGGVGMPRFINNLLTANPQNYQSKQAQPSVQQQQNRPGAPAFPPAPAL